MIDIEKITAWGEPGFPARFLARALEAVEQSGGGGASGAVRQEMAALTVAPWRD